MEPKMLTISEEQVKTVAGAYPAMRRVLRELFPDIFSPYLEVKPVTAGKTTLPVVVGGNGNAIQIRQSASELSGHALYLANTFKWEIIKDSDNTLCLVATERPLNA